MVVVTRWVGIEILHHGHATRWMGIGCTGLLSTWHVFLLVIQLV